VRTRKQMASFLKEEANSNLERHRRLHPSYKEKERKKKSPIDSDPKKPVCLTAV